MTASASPSLLTVGLDPEIVDATGGSSFFPQVDGQVIRDGIAASRKRLGELGFEVETCFVDYGATAESVLRAKLAERRFDYLVIGGGVRLDPAQTHLLEVVVNVVREAAPTTRILFNTSPASTADAVERWFPSPTPISGA